jgi:hypothetical protein
MRVRVERIFFKRSSEEDDFVIKGALLRLTIKFICENPLSYSLDETVTYSERS